MLASKIDFTLLKPDAREKDITALVRMAAENGYAMVCVNACWVRLAVAAAPSTVGVCAVVGFPLGCSGRDAKVAECKSAIAGGATEIDMVLWIGRVKDAVAASGPEERSACAAEVVSEIRAVTDECHASGALCKVIIEACLLTDEEKRAAVECCVEGGADFVKTSTGMSTGGAVVEDIRLIHECLSRLGFQERVGIKAAGGIRTAADAMSMIEAGAARIGCSRVLT